MVSGREYMLRNYSLKTTESTRAGIISAVLTPITPAHLDGSVLKEEQSQREQWGLCNWIPESKSWH